MRTIRTIEKKCKLPEGLLIPTVMMFGGFGVIMTSSAFPEHSSVDGIAFVSGGAALIVAGVLRSLCVIRHSEREFATNQRLLAEPSHTAAPPPPALLPSHALDASSPAASAFTEHASQYVTLNLQDVNELKPLQAKTSGP